MAEVCSLNVLFFVRGGASLSHSANAGDVAGAARTEGKQKRQAACKPGSVPAEAGDGHSSGTPVAGRLARPTRAAARKCAMCRPYSVLLPVGFAVPSPLPGTRCALTAPFPPYPPARRGAGRAVCFLWHFSWGRP